MNKYILRNIISTVAVTVVTLLITSFVFAPQQSTEWKAYTVSSGDTLWTIARREYGDSVDIRKKIAEICAENDIVPDKLTAGDVILISAEAE